MNPSHRLDAPVLLLDCQTTGMRPPRASVLEIAWSVTTLNEAEPAIHSFLVRPEGEFEIPAKVREITGIKRSELDSGLPEREIFQLLKRNLFSFAVVHYAQFEKPFLTDWYARFDQKDRLPFEILCTYQLIKRLFPELPSQNIRASAGFFGPPLEERNRAATHVQATHQIWRGLVAELQKRGLNTFQDVKDWMKSAALPKATRYEYRLDKVKRLEMPDQPGVYRMLAKNGKVLYVGKATSLKSRVNSYFRGRKGRDTRKLEMLAQVWDLQITPCETPLEAALLETDEIKRLDPPYNIALKAGTRRLVFFSRDFSSTSERQEATHPYGPYKEHNWIENLSALMRSQAQEEFAQIFFLPLEPKDLKRGFEIFLQTHGLPTNTFTSIRRLLAFGLNLHRHYVEPDAEKPEEGPEELDLLPPTPEEIAGKFERLLRRAGAEFWRTRQLTRLLNAQVDLGSRTLSFQNGCLVASESIPEKKPRLPWAGLRIETFDRMSILLSEIQRNQYAVHSSEP